MFHGKMEMKATLLGRDIFIWPAELYYFAEAGSHFQIVILQSGIAFIENIWDD